MTPRPARKPGAFAPSRSKASPVATPGVGCRTLSALTVALEGEPGGDTWGGLSNTFRAGVETWITGSYDRDLNLTFWGPAQAKPWMRVSRGSGSGATLYANST